MIDFKNKRIQIPMGSQLNGAQVFQLVEQEINTNYAVDGKLPENIQHPYELKQVKIGDRAGTEGINVGTSVVMLQRIQLREDWVITDQPLEEVKTETVEE
jgi:hypothetical protein